MRKRKAGRHPEKTPVQSEQVLQQGRRKIVEKWVLRRKEECLLKGRAGPQYKMSLRAWGRQHMEHLFATTFERFSIT